ncbi:hypothetical protein DMB66_45695 [Actinoplanes sp. ATCC 53533]|uniref:hypothetical protein n=1 Tax=Actinoplanes sp. ATCC 53533 TaxID=1288362 RepID=UPI000F788203|nr:hypothetical protein [Actinoplanes sp. ATCC 53533]RSM48876.1 hypothetical protein DMB66_45695 [Actinoplanes sp. ATCC 53533]
MTKIQLLALTAALTMLSGCAATGSEPGGTEAALPTLSSPAAPPSEPTDDIKPTEVIVGTVNRGGTGPCYGLVTDDGVQYALYEAKGRALTTGIRVTVDASPSRLRIACGTGTLVEVKTLTALR